MNPKVFLSYRREDSAAYAGRIAALKTGCGARLAAISCS
jgi:hypothetical protein